MHRTALERTSGGQAHLDSNRPPLLGPRQAPGKMLREREGTCEPLLTPLLYALIIPATLQNCENPHFSRGLTGTAKKAIPQASQNPIHSSLRTPHRASPTPCHVTTGLETLRPGLACPG